MRYGIALLAITFALAALPASPARAQRVTVTYDIPTDRVALDAYNAGIVAVVNTLFARVTGGGRRFVFDGDVSGPVTLHLRDVTPEVALDQALKQVGARYEVRRGVYHIVPGRTAPGSGQEGRQPGGGERLSVRLTDVTVAQAARYLSERYGKDVRVSGSAPGRVSLNLRGATLDEALQALTRSADGWRYRDYGDYVVLIPLDGLPGPEDVPEAFRRRVSITSRERPIGEVTQVLGRQANVAILYDRDVPGELTVTLVARDEPLWAVLQRLAIAARLKLAVTGPREITLRPMSRVDVDYRGDHVGSVTEVYTTCPNCHFLGLRREWRYCPMCGERIAR